MIENHEEISMNDLLAKKPRLEEIFEHS